MKLTNHWGCRENYFHTFHIVRVICPSLMKRSHHLYKKWGKNTHSMEEWMNEVNRKRSSKRHDGKYTKKWSICLKVAQRAKEIYDKVKKIIYVWNIVENTQNLKPNQKKFWSWKVQ